MLVAYYIQIDLIGLVLIVIMACSNHPGGPEPQRRRFDLLLGGTAAMLVLDAITWVLDGNPDPNAIQADHLGLTLYYILTGASAWFWLLYADTFLRRKTLGPWQYAAESAPFVLNLLLAIVSNWTGWFFTIDPATGIYSHGPLFGVHALLSYGYLAYCFIYALVRAHSTRYRTDRRQFLFLASFPILPFIGAFVQMFFYGLSLVWILTSLSLLIVFINVQNHQIATDPLTGLNNRRQLDRFLSNKIAAPRMGMSIYAVMIDLDRFKGINDQFGHIKGDEALIAVSQVLVRACLANHEFIARIGGDEFIIIGETHKDGQEAARALVEKVKIELARENQHAQRPFDISLSLGTCAMKEDCLTSIDLLVNSADHQMYEDKATHRKE